MVLFLKFVSTFPVGQGGKGDVTSSKQGNAGAVRILKPGFY